MIGSYPCYVATSPDQKLAYPHYSDDMWNTARLIYGQKQKTDNSNYSDRMWEWNYDKAEKATDTCNNQNIPNNTARRWEAWLSAYHDRPVKLIYIMAGSNRANGYPYWFLGYDYV